jgi:hypothetical protein
MFATAHGAWKGWTAQGFYLFMVFTLYVLALKISTNRETDFLFSEGDVSFRNVMYLEVISPFVVMAFFLIRRFHNRVFATHHSVPGHHVVGGFFGFLTGVFALLYLFVWIEFTEMKTQTWWTSSLEYEASEIAHDWVGIIFKALQSFLI